MRRKPFSLRNQPQPDALRYDIPKLVRNRIARALSALGQQYHGDTFFMLEEVGKRCLDTYGGMRGQSRSFIDTQHDPAQNAINHFQACTDEEAIDFIEWCFESRAYTAQQHGVDRVNEIFRETGIGYEFSPYVVVRHHVGGDSYRHEIQFPEATKKTNELLHQTTVMPCLNLLSDLRFEAANQEMLQAHRHLRDGEFDSAINSCGKAFESVFKTICELKGWKYDPDKDTIAKLIEICRDNGLFPVFYTEIFKASGIIRNKLGSHGGGPQQPHGVAIAEQAEHMIQQTSAHILLLARLAKL